MSLPALNKTAQFSVNTQIVAQGSAIACHKRGMRTLVNGLIGFANTPYVVRQSCNASAFGSTGDGVNRWSSDADLTWAAAGTAHSWIVLRQTGWGSTYELLIDLDSASGQNVSFILSATGFSGGSTTARPTATDEWVFYTASQWRINNDLSQRIHIVHSTDGQTTFVCVANSGVPAFMMILQKPANTTTGWSNPVFAFAGYSSTAWAPASSPLLHTVSNGSALARVRIGTTLGNCSFTAESCAGTPIYLDSTTGNIANEVDSCWSFWPIGFTCLTTGIRGRHGTLIDIWFGNPTSIANGDMFPDTGALGQFAYFGPFIVVWNGGAAPAFS